MVRLALLESFDSAPPTEDTGPSADWIAGHEVGLAEARATRLVDEERLKSDALQSIADMTLTFREAQNHLLDRLAPLFEAISERIVPEVLRDSFALWLMSALTETAARDLRTPLTLCFSPTDAIRIQADPALSAAGFTCREHPQLGPGQVLIDSGDHTTSFDFNQLTDGLATALAAIGDTSQRTSRHG